MASVTLEKVCKRFGGDEVLRDCSLTIDDGEFVVLVGPSGSGKTTLLRIVAGLEEASGGSVFIGDRLVNYVDVKDRQIAMVFQNYALYPHMSVYDNMAFALRRQHVTKGEIDTRVREAAAVLGIEHLLKRRPKQLSGGQRQRVALGRAIVRDPNVFLMDEPLSNLDAHLRAEMRAEILKLHRRVSGTFIFVTHDQVEALTMGDRIVVMHEGEIRQVGTPDELYLRPDNRFVAGFIGSPSMGFVDCTVHEEKGAVLLRSTAVEVRLAAGPGAAVVARGVAEVTVGIRPDYLRVVPPERVDGTATTLRGVVEVIEPLGADQHVMVRVGDSAMMAKLSRNERLSIDDKVVLTVTDEDAVHVFDPGTGEAIR